MSKKQGKDVKTGSTLTFSSADLMPRSKPGTWKYMLPIWLAITSLLWFAENLGWDIKVVAAVVFVFALLSDALVWLLGLIALLPVVGPLIVKALTLPAVWLLNAVGYLVSIMVIRRGYSKDVMTYRALTVALITGIVIGFVFGYLTGAI
ncbi:MAG TPA: hypothetical protein VJB68_01130 [Methylophilaceae bacterium]|nr:hypothetical protein [Methylophilaceae bacterium]